MLLVGIMMCFTDENLQLYSMWFLASIPITAGVFLLKSIVIIILGLRRSQKGLLLVCIIF
jgi:hypothetical protein